MEDKPEHREKVKLKILEILEAGPMLAGTLWTLFHEETKLPKSYYSRPRMELLKLIEDGRVEWGERSMLQIVEKNETETQEKASEDNS